MTAPTFMIYGANGYTGELIAREAVNSGMGPVLAGRNKEAIQALATELDLEHRCFELDNNDTIVRHLADMDVLIHCAGPFSATAEPMLQACMAAATHYTDVSGEFEVFERANALRDDAHEAGVVLCPGVGFDVIPTDCLANIALGALPDATELSVGVDAAPVLSPGSVKTMIESFTRDGSIGRIDGRWEKGAVPPKFREFSFNGVNKFAISMPLADLLAIGYSTNVDTVDVYHATPPERMAVMQNLMQHVGLLHQPDVRALVMAVVDAVVEGPGEGRREELPATLVAEAKNEAGDTVTATVSTPNGYSVTRDGALACAKLLMSFDGEGGYYTPSMLGGRALLESLPGVSEITVSAG